MNAKGVASFYSYGDIIRILNEEVLSNTDRVAIMAAVVASLCADMTESKDGLVNRQKALEVYDGAFRKSVVSGFDLVDGMLKLEASLHSQTATKQ